MEIERKWLIREFPDNVPGFTLFEDCYIEQSYIYVSNDTELRIRKRFRLDNDVESGASYKLTVKGKGTISRVEINTSITEEQYNDALKLSRLRPITKHIRTYMTEDGRKLDTSVVDEGTENEFMYAEIEFDSEEEAKAYELSLDAVDVTYDDSYKMKNYWKRTRLNQNLGPVLNMLDSE